MTIKTEYIDLLMQEEIIPKASTFVRIEANIGSQERVVYEWEKLQTEVPKDKL